MRAYRPYPPGVHDATPELARRAADTPAELTDASVFDCRPHFATRRLRVLILRARAAGRDTRDLTNLYLRRAEALGPPTVYVIERPRKWS